MPLGDRVLYEFDDFQLDAEIGALRHHGERLPLQPKAAQVLILLVEAKGACVSTDLLIRQAWQESSAGKPHLYFQLSQIKSLLATRAPDTTFIETIPRVGVRFLRPVTHASIGGSTAAAPLPRSDAPPPPPDAPPPPPQIGERGLARRHAARWRYLAVLFAGVAATTALIAVPGDSDALRVTSIDPLTDDRLGKFDAPIFTDESSVLYVIAGATYSVPLSGGASRLAVPATTYDVIGVHPSSAEYLARRHTPRENDGEVWALPVASGIPRRLGILCDSAGWSPDGTLLACAEQQRLLVATVDGTVVRSLPTPPDSTPMWPRWSPDARKIRFTSTVREDRLASVRSLWEVDVSGSGLRQVVPGPPQFYNACCGHWSPNGHFFAFQATHNGRFDLWVIREGGVSWPWSRPMPYRLTSGPLSYTSPAFGRDGSTLFAVGAPFQGEIIRYDLTSRQFATWLPISGTYLSYSPDRQAVAYIGFPDKQLWRAAADGSGQQQLTVGPFETNDATWSPDGRWIAFRSRMSGRSSRIHLIAPSGGEARPISPEDVEQGTPTWSPDGRRILFGDVPKSFGQPDGTEQLHFYDVDTAQFSQVPGSAGLWTARWSPDGRSIAALTIVGQELRIYDIQSATWRSVEVKDVGSPAWSRDAEWIYFRSVGLPPRHLSRVRVADGHVEQLVDLSGLRDAYWWLGLAPDDSPLLMRFLGGAEIYALRLER